MGSIPAEPHRSREGKQEKMLPAGPVPGGCHSGLSCAHQRCYRQGTFLIHTLRSQLFLANPILILDSMLCVLSAEFESVCL